MAMMIKAAFGVVWCTGLASLGILCNFLGSLYAMEHGAHTHAQVALAISLCLLSATWLAAEVSAKLEQYFYPPAHFERVPTLEGESMPQGKELEDGSNAKAETIGKATNGTAADKPTKTRSDKQVSMENDGPISPLQQELKSLRACAELTAICAYLYLCDRTDLFLEGQKVYDPRQFWGLWIVLSTAALATMRKLEKTTALQREQTDEWKGWMQLMFILYHYFAEKEVYNAIRIYISAYVFMTGYGNFSLYRKGKSFTTRRTLQMLFRLNFLGFIVCVLLNNEYLLYYICAMHTLFTVFVILAMYVKYEQNSSIGVLYAKIGATVLLTVILYDGPDIVFRGIFGTLPVVRPLFAFHDPLHPEYTDEMHEWHFRSGLDRFIWIIGMVYALHYPQFDAFMDKLAGIPACRATVWYAIVLVPAIAVGAVWYHYVFTLDKYGYNAMHPFTSFVPLTLYMLLRNLTAGLRSRYIFLFAYIGKYTLETYILQFHVWMKTTGLNGSPKHLMVWIPNWYYLNLMLTSAVYIFVSVRLSEVTMVLRDALLPDGIQAMTWRCGGAVLLGVVSWLAAYGFMHGDTSSAAL